MVYIHIAEYVFHWGFSVRTPYLSGAQGSYRVPPPTTIVGALACAYYALQGCKREVALIENLYVSRAVEFVKEFGVRYAVGTCIGGAQFQSNIRYFIGFYRARDMYDDLRKGAMTLSELFGPVSFGYVAAPCGTVAFIVISEKKIPEEVFYSVTRIGSRESIVSLHEVHVISYSEAIDRGILRKKRSFEEVKLPIPHDIITAVERGNYIVETHAVPRKVEEFVNYYIHGLDMHKTRISQLMIPVLPGKESEGVTVTLHGEHYVFKSGWLAAVIPSDVLE